MKNEGPCIEILILENAPQKENDTQTSLILALMPMKMVLAMSL